MSRCSFIAANIAVLLTAIVLSTFDAREKVASIAHSANVLDSVG